MPRIPDIINCREERALSRFNHIRNGLRRRRYDLSSPFRGRRDSRRADIRHAGYCGDQDVARDVKRAHGYSLDPVNRAQEHARDRGGVQYSAQ